MSHYQLVPGVESEVYTPEEKNKQIEKLEGTIQKYVPSLVLAVQIAKKKKAKCIVLHQDAYAAGYHYDEYVLLGMSVKYAGLHGVEITFIGKNGETFESKK